MNNIKLLKAQYKLSMSIVDKRGRVGIENFVTALEERIAELEAALAADNAEICAAPDCTVEGIYKIWICSDHVKLDPNGKDGQDD